MSSKFKCCVPGCVRDACFEVLLYDYYSHSGEVFSERDVTCPYLCGEHQAENERGIVGGQVARGCPRYPHSNKRHAQGFTIYRKVDDRDGKGSNVF